MTDEEIDKVIKEALGRFPHESPTVFLRDFTRTILAAQEADQFWNADCPEYPLEAENEAQAVAELMDDFCSARLPAELRLLRSKRLPAVRIMVTSIPDDGEIEYTMEYTS